MNPGWTVHTGRLVLRPVSGADLADLIRLKGDPRVFAIMLGGVRTAAETEAELAADITDWGRHGYGMWTIRVAGLDAFVGIAGLMQRADGRGPALRFALSQGQHGRGYASEAAAAVLRYAHERAALVRVVAVARASNLGSRTVLGAIGMREVERFLRDGEEMVTYASERRIGESASN